MLVELKISWAAPSSPIKLVNPTPKVPAGYHFQGFSPAYTHFNNFSNKKIYSIPEQWGQILQLGIQP